MIDRMAAPGSSNVDVVGRQPRADDPLELVIRARLENLVSSPWAKEAIEKMRLTQSDFLSFAFDNLKEPEKILQRHGQVLPQLAQICRTKIVSGEDSLKGILPGKVILVTNHLGMSKLTRIDNRDRHLPVGLDEIEPFLIRYAPLTLIADSLGAELHEASIELPGSLIRIQESCGVLTIPVSGSGRAEQLIDKIQGTLAKDQRQTFVMYPEGGTSGKRNGGGPYDLDEFHRGSFVVAARTRLPVMPVCQFFDSERGMELQIMSPFYVPESDLDSVNNVARNVRGEMQKVLTSAYQKLYPR